MGPTFSQPLYLNSPVLDLPTGSTRDAASRSEPQEDFGALTPFYVPRGKLYCQWFFCAIVWDTYDSVQIRVAMQNSNVRQKSVGHSLSISLFISRPRTGIHRSTSIPYGPGICPSGAAVPADEFHDTQNNLSDRTLRCGRLRIERNPDSVLIHMCLLWERSRGCVASIHMVTG